ncbi:hypothetical protein FM037_11545 [Shewanella psychropiezotolerans]|uniref:DUF3137 domain-containing protein n=1 Tax=Shewanella psychropiezotolerans TaxID=2593655 RepID=A0ABX5WXD4_9GAMM|nr:MULTISPECIES: hypothetical protein [Shewanella]MPY26587.1 hypothetical protein [Shewanella sp. YLB-07]QDO83750.1 hypothetical protein FM037_11545 [Shewanella psychropiezotolerans]
MSLLRQFKDMLGRQDHHASVFEPASLDDLVATITQWSALVPDNASFCSHKAKCVSATRVKFRPRMIPLILAPLLMLVGTVVILGFSFSALTHGDGTLLIGTVVGIIALVMGTKLLHQWSIVHIFDLQSGDYHTSRNQQSVIGSKQHCQLADIHAIQLLQKYIYKTYAGEGRQVTCGYELNLVFKDGSRINIVSHREHDFIQSDGQILSEFLNVPLWDATRV